MIAHYLSGIFLICFPSALLFHELSHYSLLYHYNALDHYNLFYRYNAFDREWGSFDRDASEMGVEES